jgi:chromate transporter
MGAGLVGYLGGRFAPAKFAVVTSHGPVTTPYGPAIIDDATPTPAHAIFRWSHFARICTVSLMLWAGAMAALAWYYGRDAALTQMGWFFTKAALLTFGGAYAVLPYVYQGGVEQYQWLTAAQMIDGLALGETTPGPLIMVVTFVGFVGAWTKQVFGADSLFLAGAAGALVVTYFTFLPSFVFIFLGAPLIETTHGNIKFTAPLTGITAAVVGVILNLAVFFAYHVLWPRGVSGNFDWIPAVIGTAAFVALFRLKAGIIPVILVCGALGLGYTLLRPLF